MSNANESAFATPETNEYYGSKGLTKREYFAAIAMQGLIAKLPLIDNLGVHGFPMNGPELDQLKTDAAKSALGYADALLAELEKGEK